MAERTWLQDPLYLSQHGYSQDAITWAMNNQEWATNHPDAAYYNPFVPGYNDLNNLPIPNTSYTVEPLNILFDPSTNSYEAGTGGDTYLSTKPTWTEVTADTSLNSATEPQPLGDFTKVQVDSGLFGTGKELSNKWDADKGFPNVGLFLAVAVLGAFFILK